MAVTLQRGSNFHGGFLSNMWNPTSVRSPGGLPLLLPRGSLCSAGVTCRVPSLPEGGGRTWGPGVWRREGRRGLAIRQTNERFCIVMTPLKWNRLENQSDSFSDYSATQSLRPLWGPRQQPTRGQCRKQSFELEPLGTKARSCHGACQKDGLCYK